MEKNNSPSSPSKKRKLDAEFDIEEISQNELTSLIIRCANFAAIKHSRQRRCNKDQTPYINHPIGTLFSSFNF